MKIDLHMHTTVSDGTDTPEELVEKIREAGFSVFSITDHDAVKAGALIRPLLGPDDPKFIQGAEFSCKDEEGKYHILGYRYDPDHPAMRALIAHGHQLRIKKVTARLVFLKKEFGFVFSKEDVRRLFMLDNPGKPHIANLMVKYGYASSKENAIKDYIDRIRFRSEYVRPEEAIAGILNAGGIPVLAHPFFGSGDELILGEEMEERLKKLIGYGLQGIEAYYSGFTPKLRSIAVAYAEEYRLHITAGSDYHGKNKMVALGDTGLNTEEDFPDGLRRFLKEALNETVCI